MTRPAIIVALTQTGLALAQRLSSEFEGARIHGLANRVEGADLTFESATSHIAGLFKAGHPIIGICAAGILIRSLASDLASKSDEPPVIAIAEDGSSVVPLLGGHNGANELATRIAMLLNTKPAITTAGDIRFGVALDHPPDGWTLANPDNAKEVMAALLAGETLRVEGNLDWVRNPNIPFSKSGKLSAVETIQKQPGNETTLVYHPRQLVLGVGCERNCESSELVALVDATLAAGEIAPSAIAFVASIDVKTDEPAVHDLAAHLGVPARFYTAEKLNDQADRLANPSNIVLSEVGCPGVAEGAALAGVGKSGTLLVEKTKSKRATCAIAKAADILDPDNHGLPRGHLAIVGIGPGRKDWRTPEAEACLARATDWVGYSLYLELAGPLAPHQTGHQFALGEEELRVRHALELAGQGKRVALVCSGDAGIYAMAALAFELIDVDVHDNPVSAAARRAEIMVTPGISAFQAASARAGAPFGHDFCLISLSNLLTPWEVIEQRLHGAAQGDFVVAFYNPVSKRRRWQLETARDILLKHRPPSTPVVIASNLGRDGETIRHITLQDLVPDMVDMLTLVIVGSSETRRVSSGSGQTYIYTPRGYRLAEQGDAAE